ncbi:MAG: hypothetical protein IIC90_13830 [Chloroflexi bacterium]|nr:hypothetical protein [Chloroflexota bacterium]
MNHAEGEPIQKFVVPEETVELLGLGQSDAFERQINDLIERSLLGAGPFASLSNVPRPDLADVEELFVANLVAVRSWLANLPSAMLEDGVYLMSLTDIVEALREALDRHGVPISALDFINWQGVKELIDDLPTQRVANHLLHEWARNKSLQVKHNDLYDWMGLIPAIAYCDIVVCEKLVADLANREKLRKRAVVITRLGDLPRLLTEISR